MSDVDDITLFLSLSSVLLCQKDDAMRCCSA